MAQALLAFQGRQVDIKLLPDDIRDEDFESVTEQYDEYFIIREDLYNLQTFAKLTKYLNEKLNGGN